MNRSIVNMKISLWAVVCEIAWLTCAPGWAAEGAETAYSQGSSPTADMTAATFKMLASLALIVGLIILVFYLLRRFRALGAEYRGAPSMKIIASLSVAPKRSVTVVEIGEKWLVLGVGTESINLLSTMEPTPGPSQENYSTMGSGSSFQKILKAKKLMFNQARRGDKEQ